MSLETNKALVRRHMDEAFTNHNLEVLDEQGFTVKGSSAHLDSNGKGW